MLASGARRWGSIREADPEQAWSKVCGRKIANERGLLNDSACCCAVDNELDGGD